MPEASDTPPDGVLGQPSLEAVTRNRGAAIGASGFDCPYGLGVVGGRLAVADTQNRRVLLYDGVPDRDAPATAVIGQDDFAHGEENRGVGPGPATFRWPHAIAETPGGALVVADAGNHRLLGWRRSGDAPRGPADMLVGQETFETAFEMPHVPQGPARLRFPYAVARTASGLVVADTANNRVLGFEGEPPDRGGRASWVLGQHDFGPAGENRWDRIGDDTLCWPYGLAVHGDLLAIADSGNNRVTLWRLSPPR